VGAGPRSRDLVKGYVNEYDTWYASFVSRLCLALVAVTMPIDAGALLFQGQEAEPASAPSSSSAYPGQGAPETAEELQILVAPIALYPDALVAQILSAATFPDQIAVANYWLEQNKDLTGSALGQAVNKLKHSILPTIAELVIIKLAKSEHGEPL